MFNLNFFRENDTFLPYLDEKNFLNVPIQIWAICTRYEVCKSTVLYLYIFTNQLMKCSNSNFNLIAFRIKTVLETYNLKTEFYLNIQSKP